jgi:hypothetical protein
MLLALPLAGMCPGENAPSMLGRTFALALELLVACVSRDVELVYRFRSGRPSIADVVVVGPTKALLLPPTLTLCALLEPGRTPCA